MLKIFLLLPLFVILNFAVFAQEKTDLRERDMKGKVHQINNYDVYQPSRSDELNSTEKRLSSSAVFNRSGNLRAEFDFFGNGAACYYRKKIYSYDRKNRKKGMML